jgi:hypothetical protein
MSNAIIDMPPEKQTFYNGIYLRNYEPEFVQRAKSRGKEPTFMRQELFKGNPEEIFKSLLRKRERTSEGSR